MKNKRFFTIRSGILFLALCFLAAHSVFAEVSTKKVIGETAIIEVDEAQISYLARIDTGARITSIHAIELQVNNGSENKKDNIGKELTFTTENENKERTKVTTKIVDVSRVKNAQGVEYRYVVDMKLKWLGVEKGGGMLI